MPLSAHDGDDEVDLTVYESVTPIEIFKLRPYFVGKDFLKSPNGTLTRRALNFVSRTLRAIANKIDRKGKAEETPSDTSVGLSRLLAGAHFKRPKEWDTVPCFRIFADGKEYRIYDTGIVEGLGSNAIVDDGFSDRMRIMDAYYRLALKNAVSPKDSFSFPMSGGGQGVAPNSTSMS